jgi:hypothetical protein
MAVANDARAWLFGENILLHRLFLIAVLALFTSLVTLAVEALGLAFPYAASAALISVLAKSNHANLMWLTDATHALSGIPLAFACFVPLSTSGLSRLLWPVLSCALALAGLLVREDIAALFPLVVIVQVQRAHLARKRVAPEGPRQMFVAGCLLVLRASAPLAASLALYFAARKSFVADAVMGFSFRGLASHAKMTFLPMGTRVWRSVKLGYSLLIAFLLGTTFFRTGRLGAMRWQIGTFLGCTLIACTPGLVLARSNLLMVPNLLFFFALASAVQELVRRNLHKSVALTTLALCVTLGVITFRQTRRALLSGHAQSTQTIEFAGEFLYGVYASRATIPTERRAAGEAYLREFGIYDTNSFKRALPLIIKDAQKRPKRPNVEGRPFNPPNEFLVH